MWFFALLAIGLSAIGLGMKAAQQKKAERLQVESDIRDLESQIIDWETSLGVTKTQIAETEFGISTMELALERFPGYAALEQEKVETAGKQQYQELMQNFGMMNVLAGATGRVGTGTSMQTVGAEARQNVAEFVGEDLAFDTEGGLYGMTWAELLKNLEAERQSYEGQLDVYQTSLDQLLETEETLTEAISEAESQLEDWEQELEDLTKPPSGGGPSGGGVTHGGEGSPR